MTDEPRPAATVALLRDAPGGPEVLLTHRPATMAFGPGLHVFPGGRLDPADEDPRLLARLRPPLEGDPARLHGPTFAVAAIREAWEETGILLATGPGGARSLRSVGRDTPFLDTVLDGDLELRGDWLVPLSRWVTPPVVPRRYDTRFFVAWLPDGAVPAFDEREVVAADWFTPDAALAAMADGRIDLWTPTATTLLQLAGVRDLVDVRRLAPVRPQPPPRVAMVDGAGGLVTSIVFGGAGGIPGATGTGYVIGRERVAIVDPGDPNDAAADAFLGVVAARGATVGAVLLTSSVPERAAGAEGLALRLGVPVFAPAGARRVLAGEVTELGGGEAVDVADVPVRPVAVEGGLAWAVEEAGVVAAGSAAGSWPAGWTVLR